MEWNRFYWYLDTSLNKGAIPPDQHNRMKAQARQAQLDGKTVLQWLGEQSDAKALMLNQTLSSAIDEYKIEFEIFDREAIKKKALQEIRKERDNIYQTQTEWLEAEKKLRAIEERRRLKATLESQKFYNRFSKTADDLIDSFDHAWKKDAAKRLRNKTRKNRIRKFFGLPYTP